MKTPEPSLTNGFLHQRTRFHPLSICTETNIIITIIMRINIIMQRNEASMNERARSWKALRRVTISGLCIVALLLSAACGDSAGNTQSASNASKTTESPPQSAAQLQPPEQPRHITAKHSLGESVIPAEPKRIAITHQIIMDWLLPLGIYASVAPKAGPDRDYAPYLPQDQREKLKLIGPPGNPNPEAFLAESPDVIFLNWGHEKVYDQMSKIAPTVFVASKDNWRELFRDYAAMLRKEQEGEQWLAAYQQKADKAKARIAPALKDQTVVFVRFLPKELRVYSNHPATSVGGVLYHDLGLKAPPQLASDTQYEAISLEGLVEMNPDHIFMQIGFIPESDKEAKKRYDEITEGALWKQISAVRQGHLYPVDDNFFNNSPLGKQFAIDTIVGTFAK